MEAYDDGNIFARILRGEISSARVFEDDVALAFMDVMPQVEGHVLVVPRAPARNLLDVAPETLAAFMLRVQRVGKAAVTALKADGLTLHQYSEAAGGQAVFHLHVHLLPRHHGVPIRPPGGPMAEPETLARIAARIRSALD